MNADMAGHNDCVGGHQNRCAILLMKLFPDHSHNLLKAVLSHDMAEATVGDLGWPFKQKGGEVVKAHQDLEDRVLEELGFSFKLTKEEKKIKELLDRLESYLFVMLRAPHLEKRDEWVALRAAIYVSAIQLHVHNEVSELMKEVVQ